jgi:hypothetical protein
MRRCTFEGRKSHLKRLRIHLGAFNISLVLRRMLGAGKPRELKNRAKALVSGQIGHLINLCRRRNVDPSGPGGGHASRDRSRSIPLWCLLRWKMATAATGCCGT